MPELSTNELKEVAKRIVLNQGNKYIKELLRQNDVKIGKNKSEFLENLLQGIQDGLIDQEKIDAWLQSIEGWGNQHVYLFTPPQITSADAEAAALASDFVDLFDVPENYEFPDTLTLRAANIDATEISFGWREGRDSWIRSKSKDFRDELDGEEYEFRAYREKSERKLVRFVWQFDKPYCAVFITQANEKGVHEEIFETIWTDLALAGLCEQPLPKIPLTEAFTKLNNRPELKVNSVKLNVDGGHVNLVATAPKSGIHDIEQIRQAQMGIDAGLFTSSDGIFHFNEENLQNLSRQVKVEGSGTDSRIRIWAQCTREDVERIVAEIDTYR